MTDLSCARAADRIAAARFDDPELLHHAADCPSCALEIARQRFVRAALEGESLLPTVPMGLKERLLELGDGDGDDDRDGGVDGDPAALAAADEETGAADKRRPTSGRAADPSTITEAVRAVRSAVEARIALSMGSDDEGASRQEERRPLAHRIDEGAMALKTLRRALGEHADAFVEHLTSRGTPVEEAERMCERTLVAAAWYCNLGDGSRFVRDTEARFQATLELLDLYDELRILARELWQRRGREATPDELAAGIGHSVAFVTRLLRWRRRHELMELAQHGQADLRTRRELEELLIDFGGPGRHDPHWHDRRALEREQELVREIHAGRQQRHPQRAGTIAQALDRVHGRADIVVQGYRAHVRLVAAYTPLVCHLARGFSEVGLSMTGLVLAGTVGLIEAVDDVAPTSSRFAEDAARSIQRALRTESSSQQRLNQGSATDRAAGRAPRATLGELLRRGLPAGGDVRSAAASDISNERLAWLAHVRTFASFLDRPVDELERWRQPAPHDDFGREEVDVAMLLRSPVITLCEVLTGMSVDEARATILATGLDGGDPLDAREIKQRIGGSLSEAREIKRRAGHLTRRAGLPS